MRVADKMNFNQSMKSINKNRHDQLVYQNQAATQKRVNKPSDDPIGASRILEARTQLAGLKQYQRNLLSAKEFVEYSEQSLGQMTDLLIRAKELAIQQSSDGASGPDTRRMVAMEIDQIYEQTVNIANRRFGDRYLFGGYKTEQTPFDMTGEYFGDDAEIEVEIENESYLPMNIPGSVVFLGKKLNQPIATERQLPLPTEEEGPQAVEMRGPASAETSVASTRNNQALLNTEDGHWGPQSVNIFEALKDLTISLKANDKRGVQDSLDPLNDSLDQINLARAELGSRSSSLRTGLETLQKLEVDKKIVQAEIHDVDMYELVNNLNRTQVQLEASLATSGKLMQSTLLDFLR